MGVAVLFKDIQNFSYLPMVSAVGGYTLYTNIIPIGRKNADEYIVILF